MESQTASQEKTDRLIRLPEVRRLTGLSHTSIYRMIAAGGFPAPIKLSERSSAWVNLEVERWIADRVSASRSKGA